MKLIVTQHSRARGGERGEVSDCDIFEGIVNDGCSFDDSLENGSEPHSNLRIKNMKKLMIKV